MKRLWAIVLGIILAVQCALGFVAWSGFGTPATALADDHDITFRTRR